MNNDTISICKDWVKMEDYQFKVLVLINALAINNLAYSGKLYNMCDWLGIARASKNTEQIKKALEELQKQDFISYSVVNRNYNIFLSARGRKDKRFITLKRQWVKIIKEYNIAKNGKVNKNWDTMTKELIVILDKIEQAKADCLKGAIITMKSIAEEINKSEATAGKYLNALAECKFADGFKINKERKYIVDKGGSGKDNIVCVGTYIEAVYE